MKMCLKCKDEKDRSGFSKNKAKPDGLNNYCRACQSIYRTARYKKHGQVERDRIKKRKREIKEWFIALKKTLGCLVCDERRHYVLDFHHIDPKTKTYLVSAMAMNGLSKEKILKEIAKCKVLCANCHREETWRRKAGIAQW